jgi:glycosyltransferase involved in cell wall biosynthesis
MKVLFLSLSDIPGATGQGTRVYGIARAVQAAGNEVTILTNVPSLRFGVAAEDVDGITVLKGSWPRGPFHSLVLVFHTVMGLAIVRRENIDVVQTEEMLTAIAGVIIKRLTGVRHVADMHGPWAEEMATGPDIAKTRLLHGLGRWVESLVFRRADAITVPNDQMIRPVGSAPEGSTVIPNGVDTTLFDLSLDGSVAKKRLGLEGGKVALMVTGWEDWADLETLLRAAPDVIHACPGTKVLIVGGSRRQCERLMASIDERGLTGSFILVGQKSHIEIPQYIAASDVCLALYSDIPGKGSVTSSMKIFEYLCMHRPIIATRLGSIPMAFEGLISFVRPKDPSDLAATMVRILTEPARAPTGPGFDIQAYSWASIVNRLTDLYDRISIRNGPRSG